MSCFSCCGQEEKDIKEDSFPAMVLAPVHNKTWVGMPVAGADLLNTHETELCNFRAFWGFGQPMPVSLELQGRLQFCAGSKLAWDVHKAPASAKAILDQTLKQGKRLNETQYKELKNMNTGGDLDIEMQYVEPHLQCCSSEPDGCICFSGDTCSCCPSLCSPLSCGLSCCPGIEVRCIPPGYLSDMWYYVLNFHPVISIFCYSSASRLSWLERICMEVMTFQLSFMQAWITRRFRNDPGMHYVFVALFFVSSYIIWDLMFYLFAAPCLIGGGCCGASMTFISEIIGYVVFVGIMLLSWKYVWEEGLVGQDGLDNYEFNDLLNECLILRYVMSLFIFWPVILLFRRFNLFFAWGDPEYPYVDDSGEGFKGTNADIDEGMAKALSVNKATVEKEKIWHRNNFGSAAKQAEAWIKSHVGGGYVTLLQRRFKDEEYHASLLVFKDALPKTKGGISYINMFRDLIKIGYWKIQKQQFQNACVRALNKVRIDGLSRDMEQLAELENLTSMDRFLFKTIAPALL